MFYGIVNNIPILCKEFKDRNLKTVIGNILVASLFRIFSQARFFLCSLFEMNGRGHYGTDLLAEKAEDVINAHDTSKPMFMDPLLDSVNPGRGYHLL